ncbi:hypothetical protein ACCI51_04750 [Microbulbifer echini]|uniref:DUF4410 domain-containing protein n=1 Tax=Microbulbifer echini TaxID=1529067 RepID=A0ABV4NLD8_9GAMM|nr:hypothetical protein [uncultured Microbulbifer sp.]
MSSYKTIKPLLMIVVFSILYGCGSAHVKTDIQSQNIGSYRNILIQDVRVYSNEQAAKSNAPLQEKLKRWESYSRTQLEQYVNGSKYTLINSLDEAEGNTLLVDLDVNVQYGNRALRWVVGFGAGKGGVDSVLTVKDSETGEVMYKANADSDLSMGGAGGDIGDVLEENIKELIKQYSDA